MEGWSPKGGPDSGRTYRADLHSFNFADSFVSRVVHARETLYVIVYRSFYAPRSGFLVGTPLTITLVFIQAAIMKEVATQGEYKGPLYRSIL